MASSASSGASAGGAVFQLAISDGRFDEALYKRKKLADLLRLYTRQRISQGKADPAPRLADIAATHALPVDGRYRPPIPMVSEYFKVKAQGDGGGRLKSGTSTTSLTFKLPSNGHFIGDMVLRLALGPVGDAAANDAFAPIVIPTADRPLYRWTAMPGIRAVQRASLKSDGAEADAYEPDDVLAEIKQFLDEKDRAAFMRCIGHQEPRDASYTGNGYTGYLRYTDGPQTPKLYHAGLEMFIPLFFDLGRSPDCALPTAQTAESQREVVIDLAPLDLLLQALIPAVLPPPVGPLLPAPVGQQVVDLPAGLSVSLEAELYVDTLWTDPDTHSLYLKQVKSTMVRVHRKQVFKMSSPQENLHLSALKFPTEHLIVTIRDRTNTTDFDRWWLGGTARNRLVHQTLVTPTLIWNSAVSQYQLVVRVCTEQTALDPIAQQVGLVSRGIGLYSESPAGFFSDFLPQRWRQDERHIVRGSSDPSCMLMPVGQRFPGSREVTGYLNTSAERETYLHVSLDTRLPFVANYVTGSAEVVVCAQAINWLDRNEGVSGTDSFALRYSV